MSETSCPRDGAENEHEGVAIANFDFISLVILAIKGFYSNCC